ncbi:MAG: YqiA/YcfP family alpha/beta fold hydrolase [Pseudomonadales bacterium]
MSQAVAAVIYLHGYASAPDSLKAQLALRWFNAAYPQLRLAIPLLPVSPQAAVATIDKTLQQLRSELGDAAEIALIGSSLGGYYANYFSERDACRAVLINPAVHPYRLLRDYLGEQVNPVTGERFVLVESDIDELRVLQVETMRTPDRRMVLLQTGDETLDYREAARYFATCQLHIEEGGDHSFVDFENWLPRIANFFGLR